MYPEERQFELRGLKLAAVEWGQPDGYPVMALHGWLDNAGSFDLLAPLLTGCRVLALDCAGHGRSEFRSPDASYNIWGDVADVIGVADRLGWSRFALVGHSRGAAVATLTAGSFPDRILRLGLIEGGIPIVGEPADAPATLARAVRDGETLRHRSARVFETREIALEERCRGFTTVNRRAAEVLARRSLREVEGGYSWQYDRRLKAASEVRLSVAQSEAFVAAVSAPVLAFFASESPFANRPKFRSIIAKFRNLEIVELDGGHHCHLEGHEGAIAAKLVEFFGLA